MALNTQAGVLTQPGSTGNQTISLATSFDPKAILMWTTGLPAPAGVGVNGVIGWGVGTYRGGVVQQGFQCHFHTDAAATMNVNSDSGTDALLVLRPDGASTARDLEVDLISMSSNSVVINWTNLHTTASIQVNYLILGGGDITDALAWTFTQVQLGPQDVTVASGFGNPDAVMLFHPGSTLGLSQLSKMQMGWGKSDAEQRYLSVGQIEGNTNSCVKVAQGPVMIEGDETKDDGSVVGTLELGARSTWPTDGFRIVKATQNAFDDGVVGLALRGTATFTIGSDVSPTVTGSQDLATVSGVPKAIFMWGANLPTTAGLTMSHADLTSWGIGASDMTTAAYASMADDDALGTSDCNRYWTDQAVWQARSPANALLAECGCSVVGEAVRLAWSTVDTTAREFNYVIFGEVPVVPVFEEPNVTAWADPEAPISPLAT